MTTKCSVSHRTSCEDRTKYQINLHEVAYNSIILIIFNLLDYFDVYLNSLLGLIGGLIQSSLYRCYLREVPHVSRLAWTVICQKGERSLSGHVTYPASVSKWHLVVL